MLLIDIDNGNGIGIDIGIGIEGIEKVLYSLKKAKSFVLVLYLLFKACFSFGFVFLARALNFMLKSFILKGKTNAQSVIFEM